MADEGDEWEIPPLDDDFIKGATISEASARQRQRAAAKQAKSTRKAQKRSQSKASKPPRRTTPVAPRGPDGPVEAGTDRSTRLIVIVILGLVVAAVIGNRLFFSDRGSSSPTTDTTTTVRTGPTAPTTSQPAGVITTGARRGDCLTWAQPLGAAATQAKVVACSGPHLLEYISTATDPSTDPTYPTEAEQRQRGTARCAGDVKAYLGVALDPSGRYDGSGLFPTRPGWAAGDRTIVCGIGSRLASVAELDAGETPTFTGRVRADDQARLWAAGTCLAQPLRFPEGLGTVPCDQPHVRQITGQVDLRTLAGGAPATREAANQAAVAACEPVSRAFLGTKMISNGAQLVGLEIPATSWAAGQRTTNCALDLPGAPTGPTGSA